MVTRHSSDPADELIELAAQIVESDGFGALSVRRLATEVGASRQVVYTHFGGMDGLLNKLHVHASQLIAADVAALREPVGTDESLRAAARAYVRAARTRPAMFDLTFGRPVPQFEASKESTELARAVFRDNIVHLLDAWLAQATPAHTPEQALTLARIYWSSIHGLVTIERAGHATVRDTDQLVGITVDLLLDGWRASAS